MPRPRTGWRSTTCSRARWLPAASHASRNTTRGTGDAARPVSMRISSLVGSALRSPQSTAGNGRGRVSRTKRQISATCSWRIALWSSDQLRCAQNIWIGPRGPSTSANTHKPLLALVVDRVVRAAARQLPHFVTRVIGQRDSTALPERAPVALEVGRVHGLGAAERRRELARLAARVVLPHLLQREDVGVDRAQVLDDHGESRFPRSVPAPEVPCHDPHPGRHQRSVAGVERDGLVIHHPEIMAD